MIEIVIFYFHIVAWIYAFTKVWQEKGTKTALLSFAVLAFVFIVLWTLTSPLARLIYPSKPISPYFTADTLSLILLVIPESIFYYFYFFKAKF
ncbi:MAG: hypothetical protein CH6_4485 [Candidatus Kapaibacterium sp.]|jgi:hypothetical protein|nr:MAG: hypothetical protein CH6_4485 [Candidatus Kapabacteria bacterium]ROL58606.1 MAG: hypothetical protein D9V84_02460 [Bacteroidetes/Chlorobi group bacterium Naka2016]